MVRAGHGADAPVECIRFEDFAARPFDTVLFQESSQYIPSADLFARARELTSHIVVLDEFALRPVEAPGALHSLSGFLEAAAQNGFRVTEDLDLTEQAAPTIDYFNTRLDRYREPLKRDLGITDAQVDELIASGMRYRTSYADGTYGYRLLQLTRG
jgi:hypothetical protein